MGAEGLRHVPGDVIEICDDDYAGISIGGRVLAVNNQTRTLTLDREITLPSSGTTLISLADGQGNPVSVEVQSVTDGVKVKVSRVPDGVARIQRVGAEVANVAPAPVPLCEYSVRTMTARMPSLPCSMYRKKRPSWITGRTLTATRAAR